ncbi:MAG: septum formation initiator family protein [Spirochaetales bacterium]|jgi:cell division protein FtsB|nr:septum formation initiator family protein [Spirochaetales bacterium]
MRTRLIVSAYTGLILYLVTTFFFGGTGHFAYQNTKRQLEILEKNVQSLRVQGKTLSAAVTALRSDPDRIIKEGRRLLLLQPREGIIRLTGYREKPRLLSPGGLVVLKKDTSLKLEPFLRTFAGVGGILVFLFYRRKITLKREST